MKFVETVYLDLETTGLGKNAEAVEISIINDNGKILLDTLIKPSRTKKWSSAEKIHGISPKMVKNAPSMQDLLPKIAKAIKGMEVVIYNADYDSALIPNDVLSQAEKVSCAMLEFAEIYGDWDDWHQSYTWKSLKFAAKHIGHKWRGDAHRSLADTFATRDVWKWCNGSEKFQRG